MLRDPLDQYSEWLCNKCDFSLEVSVLAKMFLIRVVRICFSTIWWSFTVFVHKVPDLERKIDQMEEELNDLSAKCDKDDDDDDDDEEEDNKFFSAWFAFGNCSLLLMLLGALWVLTDLLSRKDLKRLEFFIKELQGAVLHPHHYLLLIARSGYSCCFFVNFVVVVFVVVVDVFLILTTTFFLSPCLVYLGFQRIVQFWTPAFLIWKCCKQSLSRRNYQMICHKRLIIELSRCQPGEQEEVKEK